MAWCPFAVHKPLSENHTQGSITPRAVILHTAVSASDSLFDFFQNHSDLESHFYVTENGVIEQYMDTRIRADANKNANSFAVSIETEDGREIRPWSQAQLAALVRLVAWICDTHGIPKVQIPRADGAGIGWHVQFGAPGPWTPVAKSCPGMPRIGQTRDVLIPAVARNTPIEEEEMAFGANDFKYLMYQEKIQDKGNLSQLFAEIKDNTRGLIATVNALTKMVVDNEANDITDEGLAAALKGLLQAEIGPVIREEVAEALGKDNAQQAEEIATLVLAKVAEKLKVNAAA
ncbi:MAG TPA: peptidoglycan recognition family protein [Amycolatopsis sp.]|nr:peptidoglycan recognition family protein [Amycolatopsis sp.]